MLSLGDANTMGPIFWVLVCIPPVLFAIAFGFFYFRPARRLKKIRTAIYGLSLADIADRLAPLKHQTRRARGAWLLLNLCLAFAVIIVGAAVFHVFENAACERAYWNGSVWVGSEGGIEYRRTSEEYGRA
jgi:hypothetical protein